MGAQHHSSTAASIVQITRQTRAGLCRGCGTAAANHRVETSRGHVVKHTIYTTTYHIERTTKTDENRKIFPSTNHPFIGQVLRRCPLQHGRKP